MRLSEYTDYTLRVLLYCAENPGRLVTVAEIAAHHGISRHHLTKIVNALGHQGLVETVRGRGGGLRLLRDPATVRIGDVVRASENDFRLVECFDLRTNRCCLNPRCALKKTLIQALRAFYAELDRVTLAEIATPQPAPPAPVPPPAPGSASTPDPHHRPEARPRVEIVAAGGAPPATRRRR